MTCCQDSSCDVYTSSTSQAALDIWVMILRFMGDMPEPKVVQSPQEQKSEGGSLAKKLYGSLSRRFSGSKLAEELGEVRGCEGEGGYVRVGHKKSTAGLRD